MNADMDGGEAEMTEWCKRINNRNRINTLAIPGTHDSAAWTKYWNVPGSPGTWAQRKNITEQLDMGVRALDLRVGYASNNLTLGLTSFIGMYHGPLYLRVTLESVLAEVKEWLSSHIREFVILIFQQQGLPGQRDVSEELGIIMSDTFRDIFWRYPKLGVL